MEDLLALLCDDVIYTSQSSVSEPDTNQYKLIDSF